MVQSCAPFYALEDGRKALRAWREFTATAADEINSLAVVWSVPDVDEFPAELRRRPAVILATVYVGPPEVGARIMQPLRELATPLLDLSLVRDGGAHARPSGLPGHALDRFRRFLEELVDRYPLIEQWPVCSY